MSNYEKKYIIDMVQNNEQNIEKVDSYLNVYPGDTEIIIIKAYLELVNDNIAEGIKLLKFVLKKCPLSSDAFFLLGQAFYEIKDYYDALICLGKSKIIEAYYIIKDIHISIFFNMDICNNLINDILDCVNYSMSGMSKEDVLIIDKMLKDIKKIFDDKFDMFGDIIRNSIRNVIGEYFKIGRNGDLYFTGLYDTIDISFYKNSYNKNLLLYKTEMLKQLYCGTDISLELSNNVFVPILALENDTIVEINKNVEKKATIQISESKHFNYLKLKQGKVNIHSDKKIIVADIVPLEHRINNKKLVISLFIDGISQKVISEYGLENIMPNTYKFFKKGMVCNNAFSASDWTYPSISSLISGLSVPNHMMIHPEVNVKYPKEQKLLFEYFKEAGYHTTMLSGDWRICATYDSIRGIDRYIAKNQNCGFRTEDVLANVMDHLETFKETDQYIWIGTGDFHDVADEFSLPAAVQVKMDLEEFDIGEKSKTSVKQKYNPNKISMYAKVATHIDSKLKILYDYIEQNYNEDDFVVTLFGDHGQAYMVKTEEFHLSRGMTNIGFMTRGGGVSGVSDEYINMVDYTNIITKLAGMENVHIDSDGKLPKTFGGEIENDFAISETIHPGDPYMIAMHGSRYTFYMESNAVVTDYGKVDMSEYDIKLYDSDRNEISDEEIINKFIEYVLDRTKYIQIY